MAQATEAHHWKYVPDEEVTGDHLIAVCGVCHFIFTTLRRQLRRGADRFELHSRIEEAIASCSTESKSAGLALSSTTTGQPGLTPEVLSAVRSPRSRPSAAAIAPQPTDERLRELEAQRALWLDKRRSACDPGNSYPSSDRSRSPQAQARAASQGRVDGAEHFFPI